MIKLLINLMRRTREIGFADVMKIVYNVLDGLFFDLRHRTDTSHRMQLRDLLVYSGNLSHGTPYDPSPIRPLRQVLYDMHITPTDVFVDFGCGKGRSLLIASAFCFKRIIGVDFSPRLCEIARLNAGAYTRDKRDLPSIHIVEADASVFPIDDDCTVFYFFNPFDEIVMRPVMNNIVESWKRVPRRMFVIYLNPLQRHVIDEIRLFGLRTDVRIMGRRFRIYETPPEHDSSGARRRACLM